jgi:hypothetical protein
MWPGGMADCGRDQGQIMAVALTESMALLVAGVKKP